MRPLQKGINLVVAHTAYPAIIALGVLLHFILRSYQAGLIAATYIPVIFGALAITFLERWFPHRDSWRAKTPEILTDAVFMGVVQVVWPRILFFFLAITLLKYFNNHELNFESLWPHQWPVSLQAAAMILTADFFRYWLHRVSHEVPVLWRFHAVHHSPHRLYWVNVGRFHPIDKALQFLFDAMPFIILGVSENVLALYFVFYSINGFFQHCNIEVRLGFLNYVISGPELHRWHHSKFPQESNQNYGNNLIVWDWLFGTRFLPDGKQVDELGLKNRNYPMTFPGQMKSPFTKGLEQG